MPLNIHAGRAGSGKSYNVVQNVILKALKDGRNVVCNIPLVPEAIESDKTLTGQVFPYDIQSLDPDFFAEPVKGAIYIFDEAQKIWPAGKNVHAFPDDQKRFLSEHRHYVDSDGNSTQIVVISQDSSLLSRYIRTLCDYTFIYKKLSAVGASKSFNCYIYEGAVAEDEAAAYTPVNQYMKRYSPDVFKYYKSHTHSDSTILGADESAVDNRTTVFSNWKIKYGLPLAILAFIWAVFSVFGHFEKMKNQGETESSVTQYQGNHAQNQTNYSAPANPAFVDEITALPTPSNISQVYRITYYNVVSDRVHIADLTRNYVLSFANNCRFDRLYHVVCLLDGQFVTLNKGVLKDDKKSLF